MKKDTLVIIGNGFDLWQGLNTRYSDFAKYYHEHRSEILKKLHIKEIRVEEAGGEKYTISSVELIYGDPFAPYNLDADFWKKFEDSLGEIYSDTQAILNTPNHLCQDSVADLADFI